jgi:hypothetical protein
MKRTLIAIMCLSAGLASAECYIRSSTKISKKEIFGAPTDIQRIVTPDAKGFQCVLRYRLNIKTDWQTVEGVASAKTEDDACARAIDISRASILQEPAPTSVKSDTQMVCGDITDIKVHPVHINDVIWESEVDIHTIPAERPYFQYKRTQCRMFVERDGKSQNLYLYQGIICRENSSAHSQWRVVDKY